MGFRGGLMEIPIGYDGMIGSVAHPLATPTRLIQCDNIEYGSGILRKEGGAAKYNAVAIVGAPGMLGGWDWWPTPGTQRMVITTDAGKILKDSGAGTFPTTLMTGLGNPDDCPVFVEGGKEAAANNKKLFIFNGKNQVQVLSGDGVVTTALGTPPADWAASFPSCGCNHEGRVWGAGNSNDPHRVYYSTTTDHEVFVGGTAGSISIYPGEGTQIVQIMSFKGLLVVFKRPAGIYFIDTTNADITSWGARRLSKELGAAGPGAVCPIPDDIAFLDPGGEFNLISAVKEFGNISVKSLSSALQLSDYFHANLNFSTINRVQSVYYSDTQEAHFFLPASGSTVNNLRCVFDWKRPELPRFRSSMRDSGYALFLRQKTAPVKKPYYGSTDGFVREMNTDNRDVDGIGYNGMWQTPHLDFSHIDPKLATKRKSGMFLELLTQPKGNWNLTVTYYWDGDVGGTVQFNMGSSGVAIGTFAIGTDSLGQDQIQNKKKRFTGSGRRLSLQGANSGSGQDFAVSKMIVHYKVNDERP